MMNKRGEEMVEAAMVLPLLILLIVSLISVMLFFYTSLTSASDVQKALAGEMERGKGVFRVLKKEGGASRQITGLVGTSMSRGYSERGYVIDIGEIVRLRRLADD